MVAIGFVVLFHALIGYAFITGLAYNVVKKVADDLKTFDVQEEPPPPPEQPPPPPPEQKFEPPPMVAPPPIVQAPVIVTPPMQTVREVPVVITPQAPPAPPKPALAQPPQPRGKPQEWLSTDDYPSSAIREGVQGVTGYRLSIGLDGKVTSCTVTQSSGSTALDDQTCRLLPRRARFKPALDTAGNAIASSYSGRTRWQIPE